MFSLYLYLPEDGKLMAETCKVKVKKVKCTLVQALRLCTGRTVHRGSIGIALLFLDHGTRRGEGSASRLGRYLPLKRTGTHCTGGWVGSRAGLDRCGKSRPPPGIDPRTVQSVASRYTNYPTRTTKHVRGYKILYYFPFVTLTCWYK